MKWRAVEDAYRVMHGHRTQCSAEEYVAAMNGLKKDDLRRKILLLAARKAEAYEALSAYDREPNDLNLRIAADAMANATMTRDNDEAPQQTMLRLLPSFPPREAPVDLLQLLASSAARERRLGETLGQALDRVCSDDVALCWAHDVVCDR